jgi:hypothetical protein
MVHVLPNPPSLVAGLEERIWTLDQRRNSTLPLRDCSLSCVSRRLLVSCHVPGMVHRVVKIQFIKTCVEFSLSMIHLVANACL